MCRVLVINDDSGQSEICDFRDQVLPDQNISSCQITMDQTLPLQMSHAACNLGEKKHFTIEVYNLLSLQQFFRALIRLT